MQQTLHPEETVWLWQVAIILAAGGLWMLYELRRAPVQQHCMQCGDKIGKDEFFCDAECKQEYRNDEQHYETKDF